MKVFSRPDEPGSEVIAGIRMLGERYGIQPRQISYFTHGTTVGINTVIQRKGLRLALFTTRNFCDVLELGRLKTTDMYHLLSRRPDPLIPRDTVFGQIPFHQIACSERGPDMASAVVEAGYPLVERPVRPVTPPRAALQPRSCRANARERACEHCCPRRRPRPSPACPSR